jgi:hypothetical protein
VALAPAALARLQLLLPSNRDSVQLLRSLVALKAENRVFSLARGLPLLGRDGRSLEIGLAHGGLVVLVRPVVSV